MKYLITIIALVFMINHAHAQEEGQKMPDPKEMAMKSAEAMAVKFKLTADQKTKIAVVLTHHNEQIFKAIADNKGDQLAISAFAEKLMPQTEAKINELLTPAQRVEVLKDKEKRKAAMESGPKIQ